WLKPGVWDAVIAVAAGAAEVLFLGRYVRWLADLVGGTELSRAVRAPFAASCFAAAVGAVGTGVLCQGMPLHPLEQALRSDARVRLLTRGDFNWIELDRSGRYLFATGHGVERLRRYDIANFASPPLL